MKTLLAAITTIALSLVVAPAALAQSNGLVAAYGFEEATGSTAIDSAAGLNPGTLSGATRSASGRFGSALAFDGVNDRVNVADSASLDLTVGMTLEAWVRPDSGGWRTALMKERPGGIAYALYASTDTNRPSAEIHAETRGTSSLPGGTWSHLATTYDGATLRLYVNGTQVSSRAVTGAIAVSSGALRIGGNAVWGEYFKGLIDEVRIYNRALTAGDIQADMGRAVVAAGDTQAPTAPVLTGTAAGDDVHLSWTASTDNVGVKEYRVYRDGTLVGTRAGTAAREVDDSDRPNGTYRYTVVAVDDAGNASAASNESVLVIDLDTTAPSVSVGTTCGGTVYDSQQMRSTWGDDRGPVTIRIEVDGQTVYGPVLISGTSGTILWLWNTRAQTNGTHVMRAIARDAAGNETVSDACEFSVQNKVLTVPITSLNDGQTVSGTVRIKVDPRADGEPLTYRPVSVALLPSGPGMNPPGVTVGPGIYEWTWDTTQAENREYALTSALYFQDTGGPQVTNTIRVTVDNAVPKPTGLTADVGFNGRDVELHWNWVDGIYDYNVYRDGVKILNTSANYAADPDVAFGTHRYTVKAVRGGNESAASDEAVVTIVDGNTPPTAPWLTGTVTVDDAHLSWEPSSDNVGVKEYRVYRDGTLIATRSRSTLVYDDMNRPAGTYRYKVVAVDDGELTGTSREVELTIDPDTTPPTISVGGICGGATVHDYVTLRPSWGDDRGTVTFRIEVDGQPVFGPYTGGPGSTFWDWETRGLSNGMHVMKGYARDAAGNETVTADCEWNVHNPALTVPLSSPTDGETVSGTVTLTAEPRADGSPMAAGYPIIAVGFSVDGAGVGSDTAGPYQATWDTTKVANGLHTITTSLYWMDYGGTRGTTTTQVRVENTLPRPTGLAAAVTGDDVALNWNAVTGATEYRVFRGSDRIATLTGTSYTDADRPVGTHHYTVVAANAVGVTSGPSDEATATIAGDSTPPTITLQAVCDGRALSEYVGPINGSVSDDSGAPVTVNVDVEGQHLFGPQSVNGSFNFSWDTRKNANGPVVMKVTARDAAGNETVKDCPWTVSNRALSVPITAPADGSSVSGPVTIDFRPLANGSPTSAPVRLYIDGTLVSDGFTYTYAWDTTKVANGLHTIKADMLWQGYMQVMATSTIQVRVDNAPPPPSGLVAAYGFEETSGTTVTDSSGKSSTGTISGATSSAAGKFGRALSFDGVNDLVTVPDANPLDLTPGMTLEAWVKPTTVAGWRTVLLKERPGSLAYALYAASDNGRPMAEVAASAQREARGTTALPGNTWSHLAATYDGTTVRLYVNGTQVATGAVSGALFNSTGALRIGGNNIWGEWFSGLIDEVRVYERALSATEIQADRDRAVVPGT